MENIDPTLTLFIIFVLACMVGYYVISESPPLCIHL